MPIKWSASNGNDLTDLRSFEVDYIKIASGLTLIYTRGVVTIDVAI
jgi:hypothetical protein